MASLKHTQLSQDAVSYEIKETAPQGRELSVAYEKVEKLLSSVSDELKKLFQRVTEE